MTTPAEIYQLALLAAKKACAEAFEAWGDRGTCGFAWVDVKPARGEFYSWAKKNGHTHQGQYSGGAGYGFWLPGSEGIPTQCISVFEAGAKAFSDVLREHGLDAVNYSRMD